MCYKLRKHEHLTGKTRENIFEHDRRGKARNWSIALVSQISVNQIILVGTAPVLGYRFI